ncbi:MAG: hypothetical protein IJJ69_13400 [Oscillospiraceae bacterium]|nr:hypothetical protein [Oscillospiraceae bacterium]
MMPEESAGTSGISEIEEQQEQVQGISFPALVKSLKLPEYRKMLFDSVRIAGSLLLLLTALALVGYYTLFPSRGYFHSDTTDTIMWAEASYESGSIFNPDFGYACFLPFGTNVLMRLLIPFTGVSMTTHVFGMLGFFILFSVSLILMLRQMNWKIGWIAVTVFAELMICSGSTKLREIFWGHTIYYSLGVCFIFAGLAMIFRYMKLIKRTETFHSPERIRKNRIHLILCIISIGIWFLLTGSDQITAITIFALPVTGAVFCERWLDTDTKIFSKRNLYTLILLIVMLGMTIAGYFLTVLASQGMTADYADAYSAYSDMEKWQENLEKFPLAWLSLLGVETKANAPLMSAESAGSLLCIITGILLLILPVAALLYWKKIKDARLRILILTYWFMTLLIMMGYVFGKLSAANWRLSPIVAMSVIVSASFLRWAFSQADRKRLAVLLTACIMAVSGIHAKTILFMPKDNTAQNYLYTLAEELEKRNLTYGYATFWRANSLTVISDSKIKCRGVALEDGQLWVRKYQCNMNWYKDQTSQETYFVLLSSEEALELRESEYALLAKEHEEFALQGYVVWVFEENIF